MAKSSTVYNCEKCGYESSKWVGQCPSCGQWNSMVEGVKASQPAGFGRKKGRRVAQVKIEKLSKYKSGKIKRVKSGYEELDRVLGGGIVAGSVTLVAGPPGIGKSSLLTTVVAKLKGLYVLGEESPAQVKMRVERLGLATDFEVLPETNVEVVVAGMNKQSLVVIDSIQTMWTERLTGVAGSVGQIRESAQIILQKAKEIGVPVMIVGHVTKEGVIAGPKVLEHLVDTVLSFEGDGKHDFRLLTVKKNRFGPTDEVGVFAMQEKGLVEVSNPSALFLQEYGGVRPAGSVVTINVAGVRPILVEIQALVNPSNLGIPRRVGTGIDQRRLQVMCAVLSRHAGVKLADKDVFVNVAGGLAIKEPGVDLAVCLAIASSAKNKREKQEMINNYTLIESDIELADDD